MLGRPFTVALLVLVATAPGLASGCSSDPAPAGPQPPPSTVRAPSPAVPAATTPPTALRFPGHLPGARALSTYAGSKARSLAWRSTATPGTWLLRSACTSSRPGTTLHFAVSLAQSGAVDDEEQLGVASGEVTCDGTAHDADLGRIKPGRLAVELEVDRQTLRAYGIVVPGPA